jgi:hypothetical protein
MEASTWALAVKVFPALCGAPGAAGQGPDGREGWLLASEEFSLKGGSSMSYPLE